MLFLQNSRILCVVKFYLVNNLLHCHSALAAQWARELPPRLARARFSLRSCDVDEFPWRRDNKGISTVVVFIRHLSESLATRQSFDFDLTPSWKDTFDLHLSLLGLSILKVITLKNKIRYWHYLAAKFTKFSTSLSALLKLCIILSMILAKSYKH